MKTVDSIDKLKSTVRAIITLLLVGLLTACSTAGVAPSKRIVERAIALQVSETQQILTEQLRVNDSEPSKFEVRHIEIAEETPLVIQDLSAYRVRGTYDLSLTLAKRQITQRKNPFDLYLQRQKEGKTWRLARLQPSETETGAVWVTQLVPPG